MRGAGGSDFARQVAERNAASQPSKKFRSSGPKGAKLAAGFQDRTLERRDLESDEKATRIQALEEQMKLGQLDPSTFEKLRDQITGGELASTHLVKGLDRQLLERIRKGEDVMGTGEAQSGEDLDEALDELKEREVAPLERERVVKKGEMAPPPLPIAGNKRSRDDILAEVKAQRKAAAEARIAARPELDSRFRAINTKAASNGPPVVLDEKGREVRITVDEHGNVKKKVRKVQVVEPAAPQKPYRLLDDGIKIPASKAKVPELVEEEDDGDIFADVGTAYNPLGDEDEDDDSDDSSNEEGQTPSNPPLAPENEDPNIPKSTSASNSLSTSSIPDTEVRTSMPPPPKPAPSTNTVPRNYFKSSSSISTTEAPPQSPFNDVAFLAAIKKAGALSNISFSLGASKARDSEEEESEEAREARLRKRAAMLAGNDRDMDDMDLGFGSSRYGDAEDGEEGGSKIKLSEWKGTAGDEEEDDGPERGGGGKRKRTRKRKGDKDSAKDVLGVLERWKENAK